MGFLRRLLGSSTDRDPQADAAADAPDSVADTRAVPDAQDARDGSEAAYELDLLRGEQERMDELRQRQLRYAQYAWTPPAQGGTRRADDTDADE